ncbi:DUF2510 domain-containing protein [Rhodococcus aetherivorans]|nr:DUF2510 domain-containing protein [Rhodococcus aetherivorans]WFS15172.1 DUF2510 domain-containing protein [Rhodococcus aetherivorans]
MNPPAGWHPDPYDPSIDRYWDGQQWTGQIRPKGSDTPTQAFGDSAAADPANGGGKKRKTWPWVLGAGVLGFAVLGSVVDTDDKKDAPAAVVTTTTSSAAPTTTTAPRTTTTTAPRITSTTTAPAAVPLVPQVETTTTRAYTPPPAPTTTLSLEYSCSDAAWRESMGAEGDALCGSTWTPYTQPPAPAYTPPPTTQYTPPPAPPQQSGGTVRGGSFCSTPGATGVTTTGKLMVCAPGSDGRDRWQSAG